MWDRVTVSLSALVLAAAAGLFAVLHGGPPVPVSTSPALALPYVAPSLVVLGADGLTVRSGSERHRIGGRAARWLPTGPRGAVLLSTTATGSRQSRVDPASGRVGTSVRTGRTPASSVSQVDVLVEDADGARVEAYDLDLRPRWAAPLPTGRDYDRPVVTVGEGTFVSYRRGSQAGWRRIGADLEQSDVLVGARIAALAPSADGAALLGLREPVPPACPGCVTSQRVVEIDPASGEVLADYGVPGSYDQSWRVSAIDKVGRRVAVRWVSTSYVGQPGGLREVSAEEGTWVYDGDWTLLPGSREEQTWWQGPDDRVVARPDPSEPAFKDGLGLWWLHRAGEAIVTTKLRGELAAPGAREVWVGSVPGRLLPPL